MLNNRFCPPLHRKFWIRHWPDWASGNHLSLRWLHLVRHHLWVTPRLRCIGRILWQGIWKCQIGLDSALHSTKYLTTIEFQMLHSLQICQVSKWNFLAILFFTRYVSCQVHQFDEKVTIDRFTPTPLDIQKILFLITIISGSRISYCIGHQGTNPRRGAPTVNLWQFIMKRIDSVHVASGNEIHIRY